MNNMAMLIKILLDQHLSFSWDYSVYQTAQGYFNAPVREPHQAAVDLAEELSKEYPFGDIEDNNHYEFNSKTEKVEAGEWPQGEYLP